MRKRWKTIRITPVEGPVTQGWIWNPRTRNEKGILVLQQHRRTGRFRAYIEFGGGRKDVPMDFLMSQYPEIRDMVQGGRDYTDKVIYD